MALNDLWGQNYPLAIKISFKIAQNAEKFVSKWLRRLKNFWEFKVERLKLICWPWKARKRRILRWRIIRSCNEANKLQNATETTEKWIKMGKLGRNFHLNSKIQWNSVMGGLRYSREALKAQNQQKNEMKNASRLKNLKTCIESRKSWWKWVSKTETSGRKQKFSKIPLKEASEKPKRSPAGLGYCKKAKTVLEKWENGKKDSN